MAMDMVNPVSEDEFTNVSLSSDDRDDPRLTEQKSGDESVPFTFTNVNICHNPGSSYAIDQTFYLK